MNNFKLFIIAASAGLLVGCSSKSVSNADLAGMPVEITEARDLIRGGGPGGHPAKQLSELDRLRSMFPQGYKAIKDGDIVVLWGTPLIKGGDVEKGVPQDVFAYEKKVPTEGGYVILSGGVIKKMTPDEFKAAPRAVKTPS